VSSTPTTSTCDGGPAPAAPPPGPRRRRRAGLLVLALLGVAAVAAGGYRWWDHARARRAWDDAEAALARRDLPAAADHADRYAALRPDDPAGRFRAARAARRAGRFADARRHLGEYERLGGDADAVRLERDLLLVQQGVMGRADVRLRATVGPDHPDVGLVLEALARGYTLAERWADAREACELWRAVEPDAPGGWLWGGWVCERMAQTEPAAGFYRRALELAPDDRDVRVAYARVRLRQHDQADAAPHYRWVLDRDPDDVEALLGLAGCRIEAGRAAEAVPLIDRALAREPASGLGMALRGRAALDGGDLPAAEDWLRRAVAAEPADAEALNLLVAALRAQGKAAEAEPLVPRLEALQRDLRRLTELTRAITPRLADPGPCHEAGVIALRVGRTQQGLNLLQEALRRDPGHRPTHAALAAHFRSAGRLDLAEVHHDLAEKP
jgi:tetratricopeptide (TPR) repeat protein